MHVVDNWAHACLPSYVLICSETLAHTCWRTVPINSVLTKSIQTSTERNSFKSVPLVFVWVFEERPRLVRWSSGGMAWDMVGVFSLWRRAQGFMELRLHSVEHCGGKGQG